MFDPFSVERHRQRQLRITDYRNGKYQGGTISNPLTRDGLGMILDHNYLLGVGQWNHGVINGQTFVMFPDCTYFYGTLINTVPIKLCYFQTANNCGIFSLISSNGDNYLAFDYIEGKYMQLAVVNSRVMKNLIEEPVNQDYLLQEYNKGGTNSQIAFVDEVKYNSNFERLQIIQQFFKTEINSQFADYKSFIKYHFSNKISPNHAKLEIIESKEQFQFKFKQSSISFKSINLQHPNLIKLKSLGFYDQNFNKMQISKKFNDTFATIEESVLGVPLVYSGNPMQRPRQCMNRLHTYYKQSLSFINQYIGIDYLYRIKFIFQTVQTFFSKLQSKNQAQKLLQNPKSLSRSTYQVQKKDKYNQRSKQKFENQKESLEKIKTDVYRAANKSLNNGWSGNKQQAFNNNHIKLTNKRSSSNQLLVNRTNIFQTPGKRGSFVQQKQKYPKTHQLANRSFAYLQQERQPQYRDSTRIQIINSSGGANRQKSKSPQLSKFAYLQKQSKFSNAKKMQNIQTLTQYYEEIQNELKKQSYVQKNKSSRWEPAKKQTQFKVTSDFSLSNKNYAKKQANPAPTVFGPRRVLKFGWD